MWLRLLIVQVVRKHIFIDYWCSFIHCFLKLRQYQCFTNWIYVQRNCCFDRILIRFFFSVIFDPAAFYGHFEFDLSIAKLHGGFDKQFWESYYNVLPRAKGWNKRYKVYKLFGLLLEWQVLYCKDLFTASSLYEWWQ